MLDFVLMKVCGEPGQYFLDKMLGAGHHAPGNLCISARTRPQRLLLVIQKGQDSLTRCSSWGHKGSDPTRRLNTTTEETQLSPDHLQTAQVPGCASHPHSRRLPPLNTLAQSTAFRNKSCRFLTFPPKVKVK